MIKGSLQVESYKEVKPLMQAVLRTVARVLRLDLAVIPWGKEGDMLTRPFGCRKCHNMFTGSVSMCNEEIVICPRCQIGYVVRNNVYEAWIVKEADDSDLKRHYMYIDTDGSMRRDGWHLV